MKILFVCRGNVARSQIAEALFNSISKKHTAISAGTVAKSKGQKLIDKTPENVKLMKEISINISDKKCKKLTKRMVDYSDKIIAMCDRRTWPDFLLKSNKVIYWRTRDPKYMSYKERRRFIEQIKIKIEKF